ARFISSPYDLDAVYNKKRTLLWVGYKAHFTETCDDDAPHLITHVETTKASVTDDAVTDVSMKLSKKSSSCLICMLLTQGIWMRSCS
ncbi:MAG TPA: hypothetical protein VGT82_07355, partial [Ktedonobacteraceae bacterium]|nr:hypothetical protein [Ktedonobacteraceae bacterium]